MKAERIHSAATDCLQIALQTRPEFATDAAIVGSCSGHYGWFEARVIDLDVWIYASHANDERLGLWLMRLSKCISEAVGANGSTVQFETRAIDGPYKPAPTAVGDIVVLHLLIDTPQTYDERSKLTRYSWRKYAPFFNPTLLQERAPPRITLADVADAKWGLRYALRLLSDGTVRMSEFTLPTMTVFDRAFTSDSYQFREFCTYAVMMSARNIARALGYEEADALPNLPFADWFSRQMSDDVPMTIAREKQRDRMNAAPEISNRDLQELALRWCGMNTHKIDTGGFREHA